ncbi:MAG: hypothetical protein IJB26_04320 [Clostridia bacterium]|nr:hypothetical protein [Clostridia bacterium]
MSIYLSVDLGTTGCRSVLFDDALHTLGIAYEESTLITPKEGWTEQDANVWWNMTKSTAKAAIAKAGVDGKAVRGISISSQGITIVPVDEALNPLCNALSWLDVRAEEQIARIERDFGGEAIFTLTGKPINACYTLPKLLWLMQEKPEIVAKTWKFLMPMDFLIGKLTGRPVTDHSMASGTLFYDIKNAVWSDAILSHYGIDKNTLPDILWSGEAVGAVLPSVAEELGLSPDCVVAVGAQDQKCAAYGAGLDEGVMTISLGTAAAITKRWNEAKTEINKGVGWCGYAQPDTWVTEGVINTAGTCLRWVRDRMFRDEKYAVIDAEATEARARGSSLLFYPYMAGPSSPDYYPDSEGAFYGVSLATERGDFALAVMEGIAFQIRILLEAMEAYGNVHTLVLFGGGANSDLWCQIIADATGLAIKVPPTPEAASAGAAMLAANAVGNAIKPLGFAKEYTPSERTADYDEKYEKYRRIEKKLWA